MSSNSHFIDKKTDRKLDNAIQRMIQRHGIDRKTVDEVFDRSTLLSIEKLISNGMIDYVDFPISTGKEGNIFLAMTPDKLPVAMKIYRISTATFKHMTEYILGDPRFQSLHKSKRDIVYAWAAKEWKNLEKLYSEKIPVPKPIKKINNIVIMEFIGENRQPAPLLKDIRLDSPQLVFNELLSYIRDMFAKCDLIHSDFSQYNILYHQNHPVIIDLGQAVLKTHPRATEFLKRDITNIRKYFKRYNIDLPSEEDLFLMIIGKKEMKSI